MNYIILSITFFTVLLVSCGVKKNPIPPAHNTVPSIFELYNVDPKSRLGAEQDADELFPQDNQDGVAAPFDMDEM